MNTITRMVKKRIVKCLTLSMEANCVSDSSVMKFPSTMNPEEVIWLVSVLERQHVNQRRKANIVRVKEEWGGGVKTSTPGSSI